VRDSRDEKLFAPLMSDSFVAWWSDSKIGTAARGAYLDTREGRGYILWQRRRAKRKQKQRFRLNALALVLSAADYELLQLRY